MTTVAHAPGAERTIVCRLTSAFSNEKALVRLALGLAAIPIVDDNFVHPEPGTRRATIC